MKLPPDSVIAEAKVTQYLLVPQARADKSAFLARAGYTAGNAEALIHDLREMLHAHEATPAGTNQFGDYYELRGSLRGPNGTILSVKTIWIREHLSGECRFITLLPDKRKQK